MLHKTLIIFMLVMGMILPSQAQCPKEKPAFSEFDNSGFAFSVGWEGARGYLDHNVNVIPVSAGYRFNPKLMTGLQLRPYYLIVPKESNVSNYFTVEPDGSFAYGQFEHVHRERTDFFALPLTGFFRYCVSGQRRNSLLLEFNLGWDLLCDGGGYASHMIGGRFGFGADNRKAVIVAAGMVRFHGDFVSDNFINIRQMTLKVSFEF